MARVTLEKSVKFKALVRRIGLPKPFIRGLLETLWDVAHECGNPVIGSADDVEIAAEWPAKGRYRRGSFFAALKDGKWIDPDGNGGWQIHDYWHHAPPYVKDRKRKEDSRTGKSVVGEPLNRGNPQPSDITNKISGSKNGSNDSLINKDLSENCPEFVQSFPEKSATLAPAPAPAPALNTIHSCSADAERDRGGDDCPGFRRFWQAWPQGHFRKKGKTKCLRVWKRAGLEQIAEQVIDAVERWKASPDWLKENGQFIPGPLPWLNDTPWETDPAEMAVAAANAGSSGDPDHFVAVHPDVADLPWNRRDE